FHVKVLDEKRKGLLFARECGRKAATGDVIVNMDADCRPDEKWLSKGIRRFNDEKVVALSGPYDYYDGSSFFRYGSLYVQKVMYTLANWFVQLPFIHLGGVVNGGNGFFRAKTLEKAGYNISLKLWDDVLGEDTDTAKRISKYGKVVFDSSVVMKTSARRFERQGAMKTAFRYWLYFFKILFKRE
ncbi:MAG: glycosyltransferase, partial [Candidatus Taylorbacteria bacterium]